MPLIRKVSPENSKVIGIWCGFLVLGLFFLGLWPQLGQFFFSFLLILFGFGIVLACRVSNPDFLEKNKTQLYFSSQKVKNTFTDFLSMLALGILISAPIFIFFFKTYHQEFPYSGDHDHHLITAKRIGEYYYKGPFYETWIFARYPAAFYHLALPLRAFWDWVQWPNPLNALRWVNVLSVPLWIFALRPLLLRRQPDAYALTMGIFLFWQKEVAYYFTTTYLEPWAIIFVLLGLEASLQTVSSETEEKENSLTSPRWLGPLLCGVACWFKEQAFFSIPIAVALSYFQFQPRCLTHKVSAFCDAFLAVTPFLVYLLYRSLSPQGLPDLGTGVELTLFSPERFSEWFHRLKLQFGLGGGALLLFSLCGLSLLFFRRKINVWIVVVIFILIFSLEAFVFLNPKTIPWTGYGRYHLLVLPILAIGIWLLTSEISTYRILMIVALMLCQAPGLAKEWKWSRKSDSLRSFHEHYEAPVFLPIRSLVSHLPERERVLINDPFGNHFLGTGLIFGYSDLFRNRWFQSFVASYRQPVCECTIQTPNILLVTFPEAVGLNEKRETHLSDSILLHPGPADFRECARRLKESCLESIEEVHSGLLVGVLGMKPKRTGASSLK